MLVTGLEVEEKLEHFVEHFGRTRVRAVDLVDHHNRLETERERLACDELGLGHRSFGGIDQQNDPIHHAEDPLDLGAEVGVARRVDDIDMGDGAVCIGPLDRRAFGEDGDAPLLLQVGGIHGPLFDALIVAEGA